MQIDSQSAGKLYSAALQASRPEAVDFTDIANAAAEEGSFGATLASAARETLDTVVRGEQTAQAMMAGKADAHSVIEALAATEMALEMAVSVRDRVVEAYQEILRMPV